MRTTLKLFIQSFVKKLSYKHGLCQKIFRTEMKSVSMYPVELLSEKVNPLKDHHAGKEIEIYPITYH